MPLTVEGFGTWHWGKTRIHAHLSVCEFCGQYGRLVSYDTKRYFTALYVPLIPLGSRRIVDQCPSCTKHRAVPLAKWTGAKATALSEVVAAYEASPADPEKAHELIGTAIFYEDENALLGLAECLEQEHADKASVLAALARGMAFFSYPDAAVEMYEKSLLVEDDSAVRAVLVLLLLHISKPDLAEENLQHILDGKDAEKVTLIEMVVAGHQRAGQHDRALDLLDRTVTAMPDLENHKALGALQRTSQKHLETGKPVGKPVLPDIDATERERRWSARLAPAVGLIVLVALVAGYAIWSWHAGNHRTVFVVNGLDRSYPVAINGQILALPPYQHSRIEIREGEVEVHVRDERLAVPPQTCRIETSFLTRPFAAKLFVINPDRAAVLLWEQTEYVTTPSPDNPDRPFRLHVGDLLYEVNGVDYPFRDFPNQIDLSSRSSVVRKERFGFLDAATWSLTLSLVLEHLDKKTGIDLLRRRLGYDPTRTADLQILGSLMEDGPFLEFLKESLSRRPVLVDWHRYYQESAETVDPGRDLYAEYTGYLDREPDQTALLYLVGRAAPDPVQADIWYRRAVEGDPPSPYGYNAMAFQRLIDGRFEDALALTEKAVELEPDNETFQNVRQEALHALGRFEPLLDGSERLIVTKPLNMNLVQWRVYLLARSGQTDQIDDLIEQFAERLRSAGLDDTQIVKAQGHLHTFRAYYERQDEAFLERVAAGSGVGLDLQAAMLSGRYEEAASMTAARSDPFGHLLLYALARSAGDNALATKQLRACIDIWEDRGNAEQRQSAAWLAAEQAPELQSVRNLPMWPSQKRIVLLALGIRFPAHRQSLWSLLREFNYDGQMPYLIIRKVLANG